MLSNKQIVTTDLRTIQPFLTRVAHQVRKNSDNIHADMNVFGSLIDLAKNQILAEFQTESELGKLVEQLSDSESPVLKTEHPDYVRFVETLHHAVLHVRNTDDLTYIKAKYYPIFNTGFVEGTDYLTMILDIGRLEIDRKSVKATRTEISVTPWYKRLFSKWSKPTESHGVPNYDPKAR